jgi:hypothetical protein
LRGSLFVELRWRGGRAEDAVSFVFEVGRAEDAESLVESVRGALEFGSFIFEVLLFIFVEASLVACACGSCRSTVCESTEDVERTVSERAKEGWSEGAGYAVEEGVGCELERDHLLASSIAIHNRSFMSKPNSPQARRARDLIRGA